MIYGSKFFCSNVVLAPKGGRFFDYLDLPPKKERIIMKDKTNEEFDWDKFFILVEAEMANLQRERKRINESI